MSKFRIEVSGSSIVDSELATVQEQARFLQETLDRSAVEGLNVTLFDYDRYANVSFAKPAPVVAYTGRQESEGVVQSLVRSLVQSNLVSAEVSDQVPAITAKVVQVDGSRHYSPNYGELYDQVLSFAVNADTFATDYKSVLSDILLNNAAGGSGFMKKAKNDAKKV